MKVSISISARKLSSMGRTRSCILRVYLGSLAAAIDFEHELRKSRKKWVAKHLGHHHRTSIVRAYTGAEDCRQPLPPPPHGNHLASKFPPRPWPSEGASHAEYLGHTPTAVHSRYTGALRSALAAPFNPERAAR